MKTGRNNDDSPGGEGVLREVSPAAIKRYLLKAGASSFLLKIAYVILQFAASVLLARWLDVEGYGTYSFVIAAASIMSVVAQCGYPGLILSRLPVFEPGVEQAIKMVGEARRNILISGVLLVIFVAVFSVSASSWDNSLLIGYLLVPLLGLLALEGSVVRALGSVLLGQVPQLIVRPLLVLVLIVVVSLLAPLDPFIAVSLNVLATMLALVAAYVLANTVKFDLTKLIVGYKTQWLRSALPFLFLAGAQVVNYHADILMVALIKNEFEAGLYRVAVQVVDGLGIILVGLSSIIAPKLSKLYESEGVEAVEGILSLGHRLGVIATFIVSLPLLFFSSEILSAVFGSSYSESATILCILVSGKILYALVGFSGVALSMLGFAGVATRVMFYSILANLILNMTLIPRFGAEGAAAATAFSSVLFSVVLAYELYRRTGINGGAFNFK